MCGVKQSIKNMKQVILEIWFILSTAFICAFGILASITPDFLWSCFYIGEILIGLGVNFLCSLIFLARNEKLNKKF